MTREIELAKQYGILYGGVVEHEMRCMDWQLQNFADALVAAERAPVAACKRMECTKAEREHTPPKLASWLVDLAGRCKTPNVAVEPPAEGKSDRTGG